MKLNGMAKAIEGQCVDTEILLAAMTIEEREKLIHETMRSIRRWHELLKISAGITGEEA